MVKTCIRCRRPLKLNETAICDDCAAQVMKTGRRRRMFLSFFFNLALLVFVYFYFIRHIYP